MEIKKLLKQDIYAKIVRFFHENPNSIDTPGGVATWTNLEKDRVSSALKKLADKGILISHKVSSTTGYSYTRNRKKIAQINRLLSE
jgi:predicted transcriptional regulator